MNKKLLSLAIAAAMAAPTAAMADAVLYGRLNASIDYQDVKNAYALPTYDPKTGVKLTKGVDFEGWGFGKGNYIQGEDRASRIGVKGSEDLGNGLKAVYQVEFGINLKDTNNAINSNSDTISYRNTFVGLAGSFGTFLLGRHDTPFKVSSGKLDLFADTMADYNGTIGFEDVRADNVLAYISPSFSGFQFMAATVASGGATAGSGLNVNADEIDGAYSLAAIYSNGPFYGSLAYESMSNEMFMNSATSRAGSKVCYTPLGAPAASCNYVEDDYSKWRVGLGILDWNGFSLTAVYEEQSDLPRGGMWSKLNILDGRQAWLGPDSQSLWQIQAGYAFGNSMIKGMYGAMSRDGRSQRLPAHLKDTNDGDRSAWAIAFDHNLSKRTKAYVLYTEVDDDLENVQQSIEWSGFSLGLMHSF